MSGRAKDWFGVGCAVIAVSIWIGIVVTDSGDDGPRNVVAADMEGSGDPLRNEFEAAWAGLDRETQDSYCWALESMEPDELAAFSSELTGGDPADWNRVTEMIKQKCPEG